MDLRAAENSLFDEWAAGRPDFVRDGAVNPAQYSRSTPKLVFVLKEVNDEGGGGWDLRDFIAKGGRANTWNNITRWVKGIRSLPREMPWSEVENVDADLRRQTLQGIVALNLKKSPGGNTTDPEILAKAAQLDQSMIRRQIHLYSPDLIICCGTGDLFECVVYGSGGLKWQRTERGVWYSTAPEGHTVVAFSHPEARCANSLLHYGLIDAIRNIRAITI